MYRRVQTHIALLKSRAIYPLQMVPDRTSISCRRVVIDDHARLRLRYGNLTAEALSVRLGHLIKAEVRNTDHVSRKHPDEYLVLFRQTHGAGARWLLVIAIVGVVVSIYYYFGWIKAAFFETWTPPADAQQPARPLESRVSLLSRVTLALLALASIALGFYQGPLGSWLATR